MATKILSNAAPSTRRASPCGHIWPCLQECDHFKRWPASVRNEGDRRLGRPEFRASVYDRPGRTPAPFRLQAPRRSHERLHRPSRVPGRSRERGKPRSRCRDGGRGEHRRDGCERVPGEAQVPFVHRRFLHPVDAIHAVPTISPVHAVPAISTVPAVPAISPVHAVPTVPPRRTGHHRGARQRHVQQCIRLDAERPRRPRRAPEH